MDLIKLEELLNFHGKILTHSGDIWIQRCLLGHFDPRMSVNLKGSSWSFWSKKVGELRLKALFFFVQAWLGAAETPCLRQIARTPLTISTPTVRLPLCCSTSELPLPHPHYTSMAQELSPLMVRPFIRLLLHMRQDDTWSQLTLMSNLAYDSDIPTTSRRSDHLD